MAKKNPKRPPTKGGFKKGNQAAKGHGRKPKAAELREVDMLKEVFTKPRLKRLLNVIYGLAMDGDAYCIRFIGERFFPAEWVADQLAGESTSSLNMILAELKTEYIEAEVIEKPNE